MLEELASKPSPGPFLVFLSSEPNKDIPVGVLQRSIKLTNEPPQGLRANAKRACGFFLDEIWENAAYGTEYKNLLFSLCLYHSLVVERIKFGPSGWNNVYPFNKGDLLVCGKLLSTRVGEGGVVPWEELRFLVGEIICKDITDSWDRRLSNAYVNQFVREDIIRNPGDAEFMPGFKVPDRIPFENLLPWLDNALPPESPVAFGLQASADIGVRADQTDVLLKTLVEMQGRSSSSAGSAIGMTREEKVKVVLDDILEKLPENFDIQGVLERLEEKGPFGNAFLQECYYMNTLLSTVRSSLRLLDLALKGDITFTDALESTMMSIFNEQVPAAWRKVAYPSIRRLGSWFADLLKRIAQVDVWVRNLIPPKVVWISGLFNPQAFLTAIMQTTARKNSWALDNMVLITEVTKKTVEEMEKETLKEGAYITGLSLDGARWDTQKDVLDNPTSGSGVVLKDLYPVMPVIFVRASNTAPTDPNIYHCPVYMTPQRGSTYVFTATLKTKLPTSTWITAGTALLMDKPE